MIPINLAGTRLSGIQTTNFFSELNRIDGKTMEFEWMILSGFKTAAMLKEIQNKMGELQCDPADFKDRIIFMSMFNDIAWEAWGNEELCENDSKSVAEYCVNINASTPVYSFSLYGNCGSSKWRRVFMWTTVEQFGVFHVCVSSMHLWLEMWHQVSRTCAYAQVRLLPSCVSSLSCDQCERNLTGDVLPSASRQWLLSVSLCLCNSRLQQSARVFVFSLLSSSIVFVWLALCWLVNALAFAQDIELRRKTCCKYARQILRGHWSFMGLGSEKKWYGTYDGIPSGWWTQTADKMLLNFDEKSGHPIFRFGKRTIKKQSVEERQPIHSTACEENVQLLLKMVMFVNQLRLYGAIADMIQGFPEDQVAPGRLVASDQTVQEILIQRPVAEVPSNDERQGKPPARSRAKFWKTTRRPETIQIVLRSRFDFGRSWTILLCSSITERTEDPIFIRGICTTSRRRIGKLYKRVDQKQRTIRPCVGGKGLQNNWRISVEVWILSLFDDQTTSWIKIVNRVEKYAREAMPIQEGE